MYRKSLFVLMIVLPLMAVIGCKKKEDRVVATVGKHTITFGQLEKQYGAGPRDATPEETLEAKRKALDVLVNEKLYLNEAESRGYAENEDLKKMLDERRRILVVNQLYKVEVVDKAGVPASEVRRVYDMVCEELDLKRIRVQTEEEAKVLRDSLDAGADFGELARTHSTDQTTKDKGGSMGWVGWGRLSTELTDTAYGLDAGGISDPVQDAGGWNILMLVDRRPVQDPRPFDEEQKKIEGRLKQDKMKEMADGYLNGLKERLALTYNEDVVKSIAEKAPQERVSPWAPAPLPTVSEADREKVLVTTRKGEWTVGKIMDSAAKVPPRTSVGTPEGLKQWVDMLILQEELVAEALAKRLDRAPEVKDELKTTYEVQMVNLLHQDEVELKAEPAEDAIESEFEANEDKYAIPEKNWVSVIVTATEDQANDVLKSLKKGVDFTKLAEEKSIHPTKRRGGKMGIVYENRDPDIFNAATNLKVGQLSAPFAVQDGWAVIKVTEREAKKMRTYEEAKKMVQRDLRFKNLGILEDERLPRPSASGCGAGSISMWWR